MTKPVFSSNATFSNVLGMSTSVDVKLDWQSNSFNLNATFPEKDLVVSIKTDSSNPKMRSVTFAHKEGDGDFVTDMVAAIETKGDGKFETKFTSTPEGKANMKRGIKKYGLISLIWHKKIWNDIEEYAWESKTDVDSMTVLDFIRHVKSTSWSKMKDRCLEYKMCRRQARKFFTRMAAAEKRVTTIRNYDYDIGRWFKSQKSQALGGFMKYVMRHGPDSDSSVNAEFKLPVKMPSFKDSPKLQSREGAIYKRIRNYLSSWSRNDLKSSSNASSALIFGMGFIYTFDGKIINHPGYNSEKCSYLLTRDTISKDFTLISSKKSLTLVTPKHTITFTENNKVKIDGSEANVPLPYSSADGNYKIYSDGPYVFLNVSDYMHLMCDKHNFLCYISVDEGYSHILRGLFGTNDGNMDNEFKKMDNQISDSVTDFVNAFELSKDAECKHTAKATSNGEPNPYCATLFDDEVNSKFAPCYDTVDRTPFFDMCQEQTKGSEDDASIMCKLGSAYFTACRYKGINVTPDESCGKCGDKALSTKWTPSIEKSADVVLVVSQHENNALGSDAKEYLKGLMVKLSDKFAEKGFADTRIGVVGFGGSGYRARPMPFTSRANTMFGTPLEMNDAVDNLKFNVKTTLARDFALDAILMATKYPFRSNAARSVILISPFEAQASFEKRNILSNLRNSSIIFSSVSRYPSLERDDVDGMNWNKKLLSNSDSIDGTDGVEFPKDVYASLAKGTDGAIFDITKMWSLDNNAVIESIARRVADQLGSQPGMCRECTCHQGRAGQGVSKCKPRNCA